MVTEAQVREALKTVMDPEIGRPIEDIGMLRGIAVDGGSTCTDHTSFDWRVNTQSSRHASIGCTASASNWSRRAPRKPMRCAACCTSLVSRLTKAGQRCSKKWKSG